MDVSMFYLDSHGMALAGRLLLAGFLGSLVGLEREIHGRPAGFRTHLLVTMGACLMVGVSDHYYYLYGALPATESVRIDPARVAAQIVTGIGFLGAGAIIKEGAGVRGLTTAACLWVAAGIGMAVGAGMLGPAVLVTVLALISLLLLKRIERWVRKDRYSTLTLDCRNVDSRRAEIETLLSSYGFRVLESGVDKDCLTGATRLDFVIARSGHKDRGQVVEAFAKIEGVERVRLR